MAEVGHAAALEGVDAHPLQLKRPVIAQHGLQTRDDFFGLLFFFGVGVPAQLEVDAPDVVALLVQQHALVGVKGRVEPEPALGRVVGLHDHVGDQKPVLEHTAFDVQAQVAANRAACAVGHHQPIGFDVERAVGRFHGEGGVVVMTRDGGDLVLPTNVGAEFERARDQHFLDVVLLQVDHARALVAGVGHQVELVNLVFFQKSAADVPAHAQLAGLIGNAQTVKDFERALGIADGTRTDRDGLVVIEHQHLEPLQACINRGGQAHGACANDDQGAALRRLGAQVVRRFVGIDGVDVSTHACVSIGQFFRRL